VFARSGPDLQLEVAKGAGLVGRRRVLDSTPLYDAVATQDTVTMIRAAIRGLLRVAEEPLALELRQVLKRADDYSTAGKPACDWEDAAARAALVDALARDAYALLERLQGRTLEAKVSDAAALLAIVVGQDLEQTEDGTFRIARRVAPDRVISTVDPEARHGHKTAARGFDGYKGHIAIDPDAEIITSSTVTPGNVADGSVAKQRLEEVLPVVDPPHVPPAVDPPRGDVQQGGDAAGPIQQADAPQAASSEPVEVYGDASYGTADMLKHLEGAGAVANVKVQLPAGRDGLFSKEAFRIELASNTVTCPNGVLVQIRRSKDGSGLAVFGAACKPSPLASSCTKNKEGRSIVLNKDEQVLQRARVAQREPAWRTNYKATRPKVERKLAHLMRRRHGGRRACVRGVERVARDFAMLCAAANLNRIAVLGLRHDPSSASAWTV
jgi:Transposase DDE domain